MDTVRSSQPRLANIVPYDPKYLPADEYLSANENPRNVPEALRQEISEEISAVALNRYPDPLGNELRDMIAQANGLTRDWVILGNGGDELLFNIALAWGGPGRTMLNVPPAFSVYEANAHLTGTDVVNVARTDTFDVDEDAVINRVSQGDIDYVILTSPNNPTGKVISEDFVERLLEATDALVMIDEAYSEFSRCTVLPLLKKHKNLVILHTFSKAYSLAGVRLGYIFAHPEVITEFIKVRQLYSVDAVSQAIACVVYRNRAVFEQEIDEIIAERDLLLERLRSLDGVEAFDSDANFVLVRLEGADEIWQKLYDKGVLVRDFSHAPMLENCLRVSIGTPEENRIFFDTLKEILQQR